MVDLIFFKGVVGWFESIARALTLQLFLLALSFPVLVSFGIPLSPLVLVGNIFFMPFLTVFLAISLVIYIFECVGISAIFFCHALNMLVSVWLAALKMVPFCSLVACPKPPWPFLLMMPLGAFVVLRHYGGKRVWITLFLMGCWYTTFFGGVKWFFTPRCGEFSLMCGSKKIDCRLKNGKVCLIDRENALTSRSCTSFWMDYVLPAELARKFGMVVIDELQVGHLTPAMLRAQDRVTLLNKGYEPAIFVYAE